jgi:amidohydrolase
MMPGTGNRIRLGWSFLLLLVLWLWWVPSGAQPSRIFTQEDQNNLNQIIRQRYPFLENLYIHFHSHPELSFNEAKTSARLAEELKDIGFDVSTKIGGYGVVGILKNGKGPTVMIRTDMDALPITEKTALPYASSVRVKDKQGRDVGVMHACGHDVHMTVFVGTAFVLKQLKERWAGTLMMVGQPAEEKGAGARAMLADGLFRRFSVPDYCLALHVAADLPAGKVGYCEGYAMANVDSVDITVHGAGGHGASPHQTRDPVVAAAQIILALQSIVSREISPIDPAVITVGSIQSGTKHNIIPNEAHLQLTVRSFSNKTRVLLLNAIKRISKGISEAFGMAAPTIKIKEDPTPALYNDPALTERLVKTFNGVMGQENVVSRDPEMIGEDFARYGRTRAEIPIFMFRIGAAGQQQWQERKMAGKQLPPLHSSMFAPAAESTIKTGVKAMTAAALELFEAGNARQSGN